MPTLLNSLRLLSIRILGVSRMPVLSGAAASTPFNLPSVLPGRGLAEHDFFYAGEAKEERMFIVRGGEVVWSYTHPGKGEISDAILQPNGNILVVSNRGFVRELNRRREIAWEWTPADAPEYRMSSLQLAVRLPNGNTLINDWFNQWSGTVDRAHPPVQAIEVTPDKKIVWALRSWNAPAYLGPATTIQILDKTTPIPPPGTAR